MSTGNQGLDALADAIAERVYERLQAAQQRDESRLLDVRAASKYIGRTETALRRLISRGEIPSVRRDNRVYLDRKDLDFWIDTGKARA